MKHTPSRWWDRRAQASQSPFELPKTRAWLRKAIEDVLISSRRHCTPPAPKFTHTIDIPKRAMKLLRKIANGYRLIGILEWGTFWLFKKTLTPALSAMVHWLLEHGCIARGLVFGWSLTGAGRQVLATRTGRAVTA